MSWHFLLSQEEHDLYEFYIESYLRNTNVFLLISFFLHLHLDTRRFMDDPNGCRHFVDVLSARTTGPHEALDELRLGYGQCWGDVQRFASHAPIVGTMPWHGIRQCSVGLV